MQSIVNAKGYVVPGLGNSGKRYDSKYKKSSNWGGKRIHLTKTFMEYWINNDAIECPKLIIKDALLKYETKMKDLKEEVKDERKGNPNSKSDEKVRFVKKMNDSESVSICTKSCNLLTKSSEVAK